MTNGWNMPNIFDFLSVASARFEVFFAGVVPLAPSPTRLQLNFSTDIVGSMTSSAIPAASAIYR